jgi:hypothetical protein
MATINRTLYKNCIASEKLEVSMTLGSNQNTSEELSNDPFFIDTYAYIIVYPHTTREELVIALDAIVDDLNITRFEIYASTEAEEHPNLIKLGLPSSYNVAEAIGAADLVYEAEDALLKQDEITGDLVDILFQYDGTQLVSMGQREEMQKRVLAIIDCFKEAEFHRGLEERSECLDEKQFIFLENHMLTKLNKLGIKIPDEQYHWFNEGKPEPGPEPVLMNRRFFKVGQDNAPKLNG